MKNQDNRRILLVDDNEDIHRDFSKILGADSTSSGIASAAEDALFGESAEGAAPAEDSQVRFEIETALQGALALELVERSVAESKPFALAFVDMRMPPGWDGIETIQRLWEVDPDLQVVVCTAFADYTWTEMVAKLGRTDRLLILKKPFDAIEVSQLALALTEKWNTTRRMHEEMRAVQVASMEVRAYAASLETVNTALEQGKILAEAAANARSEFLLSVTGGILDPMTHLVDRAGAIRLHDAADDSWAELLEEVCVDGGRLASSLQDALDLAEIEAGTLKLDAAPCSPSALATAVCERHRGTAEAKGLSLSLECLDTTPAELASDVPRLERVLDHLVGNAVAYTESGSVSVTVSGEPGASGRVQFCVTDSGPGLTLEDEANLFQSFCHSAQEQRPRQGVGLGLSLSRRLARILGGELNCQSTASGTRVTLSISTAFAQTR